MNPSASTSRQTVELQGDTGDFTPTLEVISDLDGLSIIRLALSSSIPAVPPPLTLFWAHPIVDIQVQWSTRCDWRRGISVDWGAGVVSKATSQAPVVALMNDAGANRLTFAVADALNSVAMKATISEETAELHCAVKLFDEPGHAITHYETALLIDTRDVPYYEVLRDVQQWWAALPGYDPAPVPELARRPMYSTWYGFHQQVDPSGIEAQCRIAKELGCEAVIVDDGWQTADNSRGYAYCGDWDVAPERIPNMREHVDRVHAIGLKYLLWYAVPFVGLHTRAWERFHDKILTSGKSDRRFESLDPRFPEVREYLIDIYERAMRDWDLDGFKLDFVDSFSLRQENRDDIGRGRDYDSVPEAAYRLLTDVIERLRAIKPDVMIEFRQSYIGPLMRKFGNMFRAGDCPNDAVTNRIRTIDIRLLAGNTAAHADMMMWHKDDSVESAALQIINTLFAVPQISVKLDEVPESHVAMLRWWLGWWNEHRGTLLDGNLQPLYPGQHYPIVISSSQEERIIAVYADMVVRIEADAPPVMWVINGAHSGRVVLETPADIDLWQVTTYDCQGVQVGQERLVLTAGLHAIPIPRSGAAHFSRAM